MIARLRHLLRDTRGAAAMEFALVTPPFLLLILGILDLGHIMWTKSMLQGAVEKAGRDSTLQGGLATAAAIDARVAEQVRVAVPSATISVTRRTTSDFTSIGKAEPMVDNDGDGKRDPGECFMDINDSGTWDKFDPSTEGQGGASDAAVYTVNVSYPHWFPMPGLISIVTRQPQDFGDVRLSASTVLRNQPYDNGRVPRKICT